MITLSVVSHDHCEMVRSMIDSLSSLHSRLISRVVITSNMPYRDDFIKYPITNRTFDVEHIYNRVPRGFGANHNGAFKLCDTEYFCVINPDIKFLSDPFPILIDTLAAPSVGLTYPFQVDNSNSLLDFERNLVTPMALIHRHVLSRHGATYKSVPVNWVNGAFAVFKSKVFRELNGFDEGYFMYCEDVDICLRMQLIGYDLRLADTKVMHDTARRTLKNFNHFGWHVRSLLRLWQSDPYREYKRRFVYQSS